MGDILSVLFVKQVIDTGSLILPGLFEQISSSFLRPLYLQSSRGEEIVIELRWNSLVKSF